MKLIFFFLALVLACGSLQAESDQVVRVFIFAGQSNMEGADSKVADIENFPPYRGVGKAQPDVRFSYSIGRENKEESGGWVDLQPVRKMVGPELSFARKVGRHLDAPIAIIKCAAGGTHLGGDWNPENPQGFKMYPRAHDLIRSSLAKLDEQGVKYRLEGFMWHQGENDMFNEEFLKNYGENLKGFLARWRRGLDAPRLKFYIGELCTKTIWGMDLRPRMYAVSVGQKAVTTKDLLAEYVPTSHVGVEIGGGVGLHYHYGTLGQLQHGENYADAYLKTIGRLPQSGRKLKQWPLTKEFPVTLFVMAGHRNMEGERAFVQDLEEELNQENLGIPFRYNLGGGQKISDDWDPMRPAGLYDTFGPEVSFAHKLVEKGVKNFAVAKFTHSGSQMIDWTPEGSMAKSRNLYPDFIRFVSESIADLESKGHSVKLGGVFYHVGENDMSYHPFRKAAAENLTAFVVGSRSDLELPDLKWFVTQQAPTDDERVNSIDVVSMISEAAKDDPNLYHFTDLDLPEQPKKLVLNTEGIVALGRLMAIRFPGN